MFHLGSAQEKLCASLLYSGDQVNLGAPLATHEYPPIKVYTYPLVSHRPPFPFVAQPPVLVKVGQTVVVNPYTRSATNLSLTRTLEITKRYLGPHYDFEKLWEMHTHYVRHCSSSLVLVAHTSPRWLSGICRKRRNE